MKTSTYLALVVVVVAVVGGAFLVLRPAEETKEPTIYKSEELGIEFSYSEKYFVAHESSATGERSQHAIVLAEDTPGNRELFSDPNSATEGPPTITITLFQNNLESYTARSFVEGTNFSNFKLSDGNLTEVVVGGESGLRYRATGLYKNENVVVARPAYVYMFTAFFNSPTDQILVDFDEILNTVKFGPELSEADARVIAESSCIKGGDALASGGIFNENSKTWWFDANLNATQEGCKPACVVSEETKTAEINWRCTGAIPPTIEPAAPCDPIQETFSNSCNACENPLVRSYIAGECQKVEVSD